MSSKNSCENVCVGGWMCPEDDTVILPEGEGGRMAPEGQAPAGPGGPRPPSSKENTLIISTIVMIIIIAAVIVILVRACGGDNPILQSTQTAIETVIESSTVVPTVPSQTRIQQREQSRGDIQYVNWKSEVGAQPMVRDVEDVIYADLDGDSNDDALVLVRYEGSGGYLDYYVYTFRDEKLVILFEKTDVEHGRVELGAMPQSFVETIPVYAPEDPNCCPSELKLTTYTWSSSADGFVETGVEVMTNPDL